MIIGLAGRSCSGKNLVASMLISRGFDSVDMDLMVHDQLNKMADILIPEFGTAVLGHENKINRRALGEIVFANTEKLKRLEDLLYPGLHESLNLLLEQRGHENHLVINAAALQKDDFWKHCDCVLWVKSPLLLRVLRGWRRDHRPPREIIKRFAAQKELKSQYFFSRVDTYIIRNGISRSALQRRVNQWVKYLLTER